MKLHWSVSMLFLRIEHNISFFIGVYNDSLLWVYKLLAMRQSFCSLMFYRNILGIELCTLPDRKGRVYKLKEKWKIDPDKSSTYDTASEHFRQHLSVHSWSLQYKAPFINWQSTYRPISHTWINYGRLSNRRFRTSLLYFGLLVKRTAILEKEMLNG